MRRVVLCSLLSPVCFAWDGESRTNDLPFEPAVANAVRSPAVSAHRSKDSSRRAPQAKNLKDEHMVGEEITSYWEETGADSMRSMTGAESGLREVSLLCFVLYGSMAVLWALYFSLPKGDPRVVSFKTGLLCLSWCSMSIGMYVLNKSLVTALKAPILVSLAQMLITALAMASTSMGKLLSTEPRQLRTWLIVPFFFTAMLCSSCYTFQYMSLSLMTVVRNLSPLVVLPIESLVMPPEKRPQISFAVVGAISLMLCGALVYAQGIEEVSKIGLFFAVLNMALAVSDRIIQRRLLTGECKDITSDVCTLINNSLSTIPTLMLAVMTKQLQEAQSSEMRGVWTDPKALVLLFMSGFVGLGIGYFGFECQRAISAVSFMVMQNMSKVAVVSVGMGLFGDPITPLAMAGIALSLLGAFTYGWTQMQPAAPKKAEADETTQLLNDDEPKANA